MWGACRWDSTWTAKVAVSAGAHKPQGRHSCCSVHTVAVWVFPNVCPFLLTLRLLVCSLPVTRHVFSFHVGSSCWNAHVFTQAIADCRRLFEMGRGVGHEMNLLDIGGGFPRAEGSEPMCEEVRGEAERGLSRRSGVCVQGALVTESCACK